jgi:hypothetical protein
MTIIGEMNRVPVKSADLPSPIEELKRTLTVAMHKGEG